MRDWLEFPLNRRLRQNENGHAFRQSVSYRFTSPALSQTPPSSIIFNQPSRVELQSNWSGSRACASLQSWSLIRSSYQRRTARLGGIIHQTVSLGPLPYQHLKFFQTSHLSRVRTLWLWVSNLTQYELVNFFHVRYLPSGMLDFSIWILLSAIGEGKWIYCF